MKIKRCDWTSTDPLYIAYHDEEWGVPLFDEQRLFEFLLLETFQAGLSWITVLRKREHYRKVFDGFDHHVIALYGEEKVAELMKDPGIIRNALKIRAAVSNAAAYTQVQQDFGSFKNYIWGFVDGKPLQNNRSNLNEVPSSTPLSETISKDLKKRGFKFIGPTVVYAYMQAIGMVNDHTTDCFRHKELQA